MRERLARTLLYTSETPDQDADVLRRSLQDKAPAGVADALSAEVREELVEQQRRMRGRTQNASKSLFGQGVPLLGAEDATYEETTPASQAAGPGTQLVLEPLSEQSVTSRLFSGQPGMNEAITVAKLTWKIFRSGKL